MKPIIILPPNTMSDEDIKMLRENGLCVVVSEDPAKVKFVDPIPSASNRTEMESAAIRLSRLLLAKRWGGYTTSGTLGQDDICKMYVDLLVSGTSLDWQGNTQEQEEKYFSQEKQNEIARIAREEAREERAAAKAAKAKK